MAEEHKKVNDIVEVVHAQFQHASANELKNIIQTSSPEFQALTPTDIDNWYCECGRFCTGCAEGKLKEHAWVKSTNNCFQRAPEK
jgi:hypothetical protein